jgi:hypothetical protein
LIERARLFDRLSKHNAHEARQKIASPRDFRTAHDALHPRDEADGKVRRFDRKLQKLSRARLILVTLSAHTNC